MKNKNNKTDDSPFIAIPASLAGIFLVIVFMFLIFAKDQLRSLDSIVWAFAVMGIVAIIFAYKTKEKKKR
jgi:L-asparagine transporter-like permease